ncbi:Delta-9 acyl-lipid desaturase 2 [Stigmatella aurantiaca DW4/3-1]|uniref:Delta-9 acyl-lipid desaturase 2 n=1 Tax=Stigmatella aurantiaca (strain DW4/3-1) TaxID=378806 RepID=E3FE93_STIAD|nr:Delta-9 acyl-lipid desaturase 2 [Stigmatella aurantiaca DW4/3-1]
MRTRQRLHALVSLFLPLAGTLLTLARLFTQGLLAADLGLLVLMYTVTMTGVDVGYHRLFSHRSFKARSSLRALLAVCGSMAAQGPPIYWASNHRLHHARSDTEDDLHSPHVNGEGQRRGRLAGLWHSHAGWMFGHTPANPIRLAKDLLRDTTLTRINQLYYLWVMLGLLLPTALGGLLAGTWQGAWSGFLWGGLARMFFVQHATFSGNSLCHFFGSRPHRTGDWSTNNLWLVIPTFGGAMHNNHHAFPSSAFVGSRWWHFDLGGGLIRLFAKLGLASGIKVPSPEARLLLATDSRDTAGP